MPMKRLACFVIAILAVCNSITLAQDALQPVFVGDTLASTLFWSSNGDEIVILSNTNTDGSQRDLYDFIWIAYNVHEQELSSSETWPLLPTLTAEDIANFTPIVTRDEFDNIFISPNERYIVYSSIGIDNEPLVTIGDRQLNTLYHTNIPSTGFDDYTYEAYVLWQENNLGFVVANSAAVSTIPQTFHYISGFEANISDASIISIRNLVSLDGTVTTLNIHDLSNDGTKILASVRNADGQVVPAIIRPNNLTEITLLPQIAGIQDGRFISNTELVIVTQNMIGVYHTENLEFISQDNLLPEYPGIRRISPDEQSVAILSLSNTTQNQLFVVDISDITNQTDATLRLSLLSTCFPSLDTIRVWRVHNPNPNPINFTWAVVGTDQTGTGTVPGGSEENPGKVTFETTAVAASDTVTISVDDTVQDTVSSDTC